MTRHGPSLRIDAAVVAILAAALALACGLRAIGHNPPMDGTKSYLSPNGAADYLGVPLPTIRDAIKREELIPDIKILGPGGKVTSVGISKARASRWKRAVRERQERGGQGRPVTWSE